MTPDPAGTGRGTAHPRSVEGDAWHRTARAERNHNSIRVTIFFSFASGGACAFRGSALLMKE